LLIEFGETSAFHNIPVIQATISNLRYLPLIQSVSVGAVPSAIHLPTAQHSYDVDHILAIE
jgi:hypothetical protein